MSGMTYHSINNRKHNLRLSLPYSSSSSCAVSEQFGVLEKLAKVCGIQRATEGPRKAKITFIMAHNVEREKKQTNIRRLMLL